MKLVRRCDCGSARDRNGSLGSNPERREPEPKLGRISSNDF
jgi:hypothetical protein